MKKWPVLVMLALAFRGGAAQSPPALSWYKGSLHTHTSNSDGDSAPLEVIGWYKRNGYHFLALSDHNVFTDPTPLDDPGDNFLLVGSEEIGLVDAGAGEKGVHVNGIGITKVIPPPKAPTVAEILQASLDAVRGQGGIPLVNHPNFRWAFTAREMSLLKGFFLLEIASGLALSNHVGDGRTPSAEQMWDELLSSGMNAFGVAVDDAHNFRQDFTIDRSNPGRGWVVVHARSLTRDDILAALTSGDFYASSGVTLTAVVRTANSLTVEIQSDRPENADVIARAAAASRPNPLQFRYRVVFIGDGGRVLAVSHDNPARYELTGTERYVRARVEDSGGRFAWTQPVLVRAR